MSTTIRDLLTDPGLRLEPVVAGEQDRQVRWVHVCELADPSPYLMGGEFVLTAGMWRRDTSAPAFVRALATRDVAGIGFGRLAATGSVPAPLVQACREQGLTLAAVPVSTPFIAVSTWFVERRSLEREAALRATLQLAQDLLEAADDDAAPGGDALVPVTTELSRALGCGVLVADDHGQVLAITPRASPPTTGSLRAAVRERPGGAGATIDVPGWRLHPIAASGRRVALVGISVTGVPTGTGGVAVAGGTLGAAEDDLVRRARVDMAVPVVGLVLARRRAVREGERRLSGELVSFVLSRQDVAVAARLPAYGIDPDGMLVAVVLAVSDPDHDLVAVERWCRRRGVDAVVALRGGEIHLVLEVDRSGDAAPTGQAMRLAREVAAAARARATGVGTAADGVGGLRRSLVQAAQACQVSRRGGGAVVGPADTGGYELLLALQDPDIIDAFHDGLLGPLTRYDTQHGSDLVETLRAFLVHDGRWQATADVLRVHVNTLRQRLARVESLTGRSVERTGDRVDLWLALHVTPHQQPSSPGNGPPPA